MRDAIVHNGYSMRIALCVLNGDRRVTPKASIYPKFAQEGMDMSSLLNCQSRYYLGTIPDVRQSWISFYQKPRMMHKSGTPMYSAVQSMIFCNYRLGGPQHVLYFPRSNYFTIIRRSLGRRFIP